MITATTAFLDANELLVKEPIFLIEITGYDKVFTNKETNVSGQVPWLEDLQDFSTTIADLDGGSDLGQLVFTVTDWQQQVTDDFPDFVFEGKVVTLRSGFKGMSQTDFVTLFTGIVNEVDSANNNLSYTFTCVDNSSKLTQNVYTIGDDTFPTSSDHIKTVEGHPLQLFLDVCDVLGITNVNSVKIASYRDGAYAGLVFRFKLDTSPVALDFIKNELLKPLGAYLWTNNLGQLDVNFFYKESAEAVATFTMDETYDVPVALQSPLLNVVQFRFDKSDPSSSNTTSNSDFFSELLSQSASSLAKYSDQAGPTTIESQGMRSAFQGFFQAAVTSQLIFLRYGFKNLRFEDFPLIWKMCILEPGDLVQVTNPFVPDRQAGVLGITDKLFEVLDRNWSFLEGKVTLTLIDADYIKKFGTFKITPNTEPNYIDDTTDNKKKYMYLCNDSDQYSNADPGNTLGLVTT